MQSHSLSTAARRTGVFTSGVSGRHAVGVCHPRAGRRQSFQVVAAVKVGEKAPDFTLKDQVSQLQLQRHKVLRRMKLDVQP